VGHHLAVEFQKPIVVFVMLEKFFQHFFYLNTCHKYY